MDHGDVQVTDWDGRQAVTRLSAEKAHEEARARQIHAEAAAVGVEWARDEAGYEELRAFASEGGVLPPSLARRLAAIESTHPVMELGARDGAKAIWAYVEPHLEGSRRQAAGGIG